MALQLVGNFLVVSAATWLIWKCSGRLEETSQHLATYYGLPEIVKGSLITAVSSSFPEFSSVVLATLLHGEFELGVSAIVGSAIFNILVIPPLSVLFGAGNLPTNRELVFKEAQFYLLAICVLWLSFALAVIYQPQPGPARHGLLTRELALIPVALYVLYLFIQYQEAKDHQPEPLKTPLRVGRAWGVLLVSVALVAIGVEFLIRCALHLGQLLHTPVFVWGFTIIAASTSLPDLFISVQASQKDRSLTSLSNVLGSNVFDLLIAVPVGVLIGGATPINFSRAAPMMGFLIVATLIMFVLMRQEMELTKGDASLLLVLYLAFVVWILLESFGVSRVLGL